MRSVLPAAATLAAALASVVVPASPAAASHCVAWAEPPRAVGGQVVSDGTFACSVASNLDIVVCVQALREGTWRVHTCAGESAYGTFVAASVWACVQDALLVRTSVSGSDAGGHVATATSVPAPPGIGSCGP